MIVKNGSATCINCGYGWSTLSEMAPCVTRKSLFFYSCHHD